MYDPADTFWQDRLTAAKTAAVAFDAAILAFATTNAQSYQLDTGQTRLLVSRAEVGRLIAARDAQLALVDLLEARLGIRCSVHIVPGF